MSLLSIDTLRAKCQNLDDYAPHKMSLDYRVHPISDTFAAFYLQKVVEVDSYFEPTLYRVKESIVDVLEAPSLNARRLTQLLKGEFVDLYRRESGGFAWVQNLRDGYVGYIKMASLTCVEECKPCQMDEAIVRAPKTFSYTEPDLKSTVKNELYLGSVVSGMGAENGYQQTDLGFITEKHLISGQFLEGDWLETMLLFQGVPYLWGGKSFKGIDCSGLMQVVLNAYGIDCPRDSDQQAASLGQELAPKESLQRGDFVFFKGHVGVMLDATQILHANQTAMSVTIDPLNFVQSIAGPILCRRRLGSVEK